MGNRPTLRVCWNSRKIIFTALSIAVFSSAAIYAATKSSPLSPLPPLTPTIVKPIPGFHVRPLPNSGKNGTLVPPTLPEGTSGESNSDIVNYESGPAQYIDKQKRWHMTGGVYFTQNDAHLDMDSGLVNLDNDMNASDAKSLSPVHLYDKQNDLTGENGYVDFKKHEAIITGHVMLIAKPGSKEKTASKDSVRSQFKDVATLTCDKLLYNYKRKKANIPGSVTIYQKDRTITADHGEYDGYAKTVTLTGNVHATDRSGNVVNAPKLVAGIQEGKEWIYIPGRIQGKLPVKKDNTQPEETPPSPEPPPAMPPIPETQPENKSAQPAQTGPSVPGNGANPSKPSSSSNAEGESAH